MAIRQKTSVTLDISAKGHSHSQAEISVRDVSFSIDEPIERGGTNTGPSPTETALGGLLGCTNVIAHKCAEKLGLDIGQLTIDARYDFDRRGVMLMEEVDKPFTRIELDITASGTVSEPELLQLSEEVAKYCPLAKLFRQAGTKIEENWHK